MGPGHSHFLHDLPAPLKAVTKGGYAVHSLQI
jgi:hypothetical protein